MARPTNQVKNETMIQPQTRGAGPAYSRLEPYRGVIPVKRVMVENDMASVLNKVCTKTSTKLGLVSNNSQRKSRICVTICLRSSCLYPSSLRRFSAGSICSIYVRSFDFYSRLCTCTTQHSRNLSQLKQSMDTTRQKTGNFCSIGERDRKLTDSSTATEFYFIFVITSSVEVKGPKTPQKPLHNMNMVLFIAKFEVHASQCVLVLQ